MKGIKICALRPKLLERFNKGGFTGCGIRRMHRGIKMSVQIQSQNLNQKYRLASYVNKIVSALN
jgi:hypothetical protein